MKSKWIYFIVSAVAILAVVYPVIYYQFNSASVNSDPFSCTPLIPCQGVPQASSLCQKICYVYMENSTFVPSAINVTAGTTIIWINHDGFSHTSTTVNSTGWSSPPIPPGQRYNVSITNTFIIGAYYYHCNIHPMMIGVVNVVANMKS